MNTPSSVERKHASENFTEVIKSARTGNEEALNILMDFARVVIREQATSKFPAEVATRMDPSDVIQESLLEASRDFQSFRGQSANEWRAWLERVLSRNLVECVRKHVNAEKRSVIQERFLEGGQDTLPADDSSPSRQTMRGERDQWLRTLQATLGPDQQRILELRYWHGASLTEIASCMELSKSGVARLLRKSLETLRRGLSKGNNSDDSPS